MAIAYTNHGVAATSSTAATTTGAKAVTAVAGDTIIVCVALAGGTSPSVSDSAGNTYSLLVGPTTNTDTCWMFATRNIPGSVTSVTVTWTTAARWAVAIDTWSGVTGFGVTATNTGTSLSPGVTLPSLGANSWGVAAMLAAHTTATWSALSPNNLRQHIAGASTSTPGAALADETGSTQNGASISLSKAWVALGLELQGAVAGVPYDLPHSPQYQSFIAT